MRSNPSRAIAWLRECVRDGNPNRDEFARKRMSAAKAGSPSITLAIRLKSMLGFAVKASTWLAIGLNGGRLHSLTGMVTTSVWRAITASVSSGRLASLDLAPVTVACTGVISANAGGFSAHFG